MRTARTTCEPRQFERFKTGPRVEHQPNAEVGGQTEVGPRRAPETIAEFESEERDILQTLEGTRVGFDFGGEGRDEVLPVGRPHE